LTGAIVAVTSLRKNLTVALATALVGGAIAFAISEHPGSSQRFGRRRGSVYSAPIRR